MAKASSIVAPGSNWAALQSKIAATPTASNRSDPGVPTQAGSINQALSNKQRRRAMMKAAGGLGGDSLEGKVGESSSASSRADGRDNNSVRVDGTAAAKEAVSLLPVPTDCTDLRLVEELRAMVAGKAVLTESQKAPGNYIALDCEMVGLGRLGSESCLARISVVNYHGHVLLDTFVQPRETVTDWRTWISGIRASDVVGAPEFDAVQKQVADLCEGRIVVGHALENDRKALLLSHPGPMTRDTQTCKPLREKAKTKKPGLKRLAEMELGIRIQTGAHSSVTDARATMALYRLHKTVWEQQLRPITEAYREKMGLPSLGRSNGKGKEKSVSTDPPASGSAPIAMDTANKAGKRKREPEERVDRFEDEGGLLWPAESEDKRKRKGGKKGKEDAGGQGGYPGGGMKGISSGVSEVIRYKDGTKEVRGRNGQVISTTKQGGNWWEEDAA